MTTNATPPTSRPCPAEQVAHATLRLIADHPGTLGRLRCARIVGGYSVPHRDDEQQAAMQKYALQLDWPLRDLTALVDALEQGGLLTHTAGPRPTLVITRAGHRALDALDHDAAKPAEVVPC